MSKAGAGGADPLGGGSGGDSPTVESPDVSVSEEVVWKARAEEAEALVEELEAQVAQLELALSEARASVSRVERLGEIDRELTAARAVDLETARLLTEAVVAEMDEPDVASAVRELRDRKPFLFGGRGQGTGGGVSMSPAGGDVGGGSLGAMAQHARSSGDRSELLRYLRARRIG